MPISPSRTCARQMAHSRSLQNGMTMIEILVVLSIIATAAFVVTLSLPSQSAERSLHQEADLLSARLNLAAERSLIEGRVFRFGWSSEGYGFEEWVQGDWRAVQDMPLSAVHRFDRALVLTDGDGAGGGQVVLTPDLLPPEEGAVAFVLRGDGGDVRLRFDGFAARRWADAD